MSNLFKDRFSPSFYDKFCNDLTIVSPTFDSPKFIQLIFDNDWKTRELKQRMRHTSTVLHIFMPNDFLKAADIICNLIAYYQTEGIKEDEIEYCFLPDYIEQFGIEHYDTSVRAIEIVTQFTSCEFAVRPFIIKYGDKMIKQMLRWSKHKNEKVRRLSSEGIRPRLPWAMALPSLKKNPEPILPILENLKTDTSENVRRSVANNLNDISKDNPDFVVSIAKKWKGLSKEIDWIIKHGSRTLLKQGNTKTLSHFGLNNGSYIKLSNFKLLTPTVKIGEDLIFSFSLKNSYKKKQTIRLEYGLYYRKANGQLSKKVFKISEREYEPTEIVNHKRKQSFRVITTRKFYSGKHKISIISNGKEHNAIEFNLI